jgi:hypothetical protein
VLQAFDLRHAIKVVASGDRLGAADRHASASSIKRWSGTREWTMLGATRRKRAMTTTGRRISRRLRR